MSINGNGNGHAEEVTAEEHAMRAEQSAQRSALSARNTQAAAMRIELAAGRFERDVSDLRREQRETRKDVRQLAEVVNAAITAPPKPAPSASLPDFDLSDTGTHRLVPVETLDNLLTERAQRHDAQTYRRISKRVRMLLIAAATGASTLAGEQLLHYLLAHH